MARKSERASLVLTDDERQQLKQLSGSRTAARREVERSRILLLNADGTSISGVAQALVVTRRTVYKCIDKALAKFVRERAVEAGHHSLQRAAKATVWRILNAHDIKPHRIKYYLERRDAEFERKMQDVLVVYREIGLTLVQDPKPPNAVLSTRSVSTKNPVFKPSPIPPRICHRYPVSRVASLAIMSMSVTGRCRSSPAWICTTDT